MENWQECEVCAWGGLVILLAVAVGANSVRPCGLTHPPNAPGGYGIRPYGANVQVGRNFHFASVGEHSICSRAALRQRKAPRANAVRPYTSSHIQQHTLHDFSLDNPPNPVYNKYNSKMYKGVTVL